MERYDVVVVGGATAGSYFARKIAERGHSVLVLEAQSEEAVGARYDIFHIAQADFARFGLPLPEEGVDKAFAFSDSAALSAFGRHPKRTRCGVVGMHMHAYTLRLNRWAREAGARIEYEAAFTGFTYDEKGRIAGVTYTRGGETYSVSARLVADCSGIASCARRALPPGCGVETFAIAPEEMFYVTLRYVKYKNPADYLIGSRGWTYYKAWEAPSGDPAGAILGVGANGSYEACERVFSELGKAVKLPEYELEHIERGVTPYRRPPYSFVSDGFVCCGDAACLTKPSAGEGVTSAMAHMEIACETASRLLCGEAYLTREALWEINRRYNAGQGGAFAGQLATLADAVATSALENEFFFEKDIIFSQKTFEGMAEGKPLAFSGAETARMVCVMLGGVLAGRLRVSTIRALLHGMRMGDKMSAHYAAYPASPEGFPAFCEKADALWGACARMADAGV